MKTTFTQLKDVLQRIKQIHDEASDLCTHALDVEDERSDLLVDFFGQWERRLSHCFESLPPQREKTILDTWVQYAGTEEVEAALVDVRRAQHQDPDELVAKLLELQEQILQLLSQLAETQPTPDARQILSALVEFEQKATGDLSSAIVMRRDA